MSRFLWFSVYVQQALDKESANYHKSPCGSYCS